MQKSIKNKPGGARAKVQEFGSVLSGMVMPNIGAFITWGLITAMFLETGWFPNENLGRLISPMLTYLLPVLIGYTGGYNFYGVRGGVIGAAATMGVVVGSEIPMFMGAMIMGPISAITLKKLDGILDGHIKPGFEMIVNNFASGILGIILVLLGFFGIGPLVQAINLVLSSGVDFLIDKGLIPLSSLFIEPAKVLFLNNAINHGILSPIGLTQAAEHGKSILFVLEPNPGPGLGVLLAYTFFGRGTAKSTAPGVALIHCIGGIHEPYFPFILMKPVMIVAAMLGAVAGNYVFYFFNIGLVATASPGSFFSILAVAPRSDYLPILLGIFVSTAVSFLIGSVILKSSKNSNDDEEPAAEKADMEKISHVDNKIQNKPIKNIFVACDAGMGSSVMGSSILKKKIKELNLDATVNHTSITNIPEDVDLIVTHESLYNRVINENPGKYVVSIDNFLETPKYDEIAMIVKNSFDNDTNLEVNNDVLLKNNIVIDNNLKNKNDVLERVQELLQESGYVRSDYINGMNKREQSAPTNFGIGLAIPHGTNEDKKEIINSGIVVVMVPDGVEWNDEKVRLIIGIAGKNDEHIKILANIAESINSKDIVDSIVDNEDIDKIYELLTRNFK